MSNITREEIEHYLQAAKMIQTCDVDKGKHVTVTPEHMIEIARIALASLEAKPVGYYRKGGDGYYLSSPTEQKQGTTPLFAIQPAPALWLSDLSNRFKMRVPSTTTPARPKPVSSSVLHDFYVAWAAWLDNGAVGDDFSRDVGLCINLFDWCDHHGLDSEPALYEIHDAFTAAG
ncbi:hypothetical protein GTGU_04724, partial [Trabulsiella guamensis ATCC 49490]